MKHFPRPQCPSFKHHTESQWSAFELGCTVYQSEIRVEVGKNRANNPCKKDRKNRRVCVSLFSKITGYKACASSSIQLLDVDGGTVSYCRITEYAELEGTRRDYQV